MHELAVDLAEDLTEMPRVPGATPFAFKRSAPKLSHPSRIAAWEAATLRSRINWIWRKLRLSLKRLIGE
jgi:hypothetical protein